MVVGFRVAPFEPGGGARLDLVERDATRPCECGEGRCEAVGMRCGEELLGIGACARSAELGLCRCLYDESAAASGDGAAPAAPLHERGCFEGRDRSIVNERR